MDRHWTIEDVADACEMLDLSEDLSAEWARVSRMVDKEPPSPPREIRPENRAKVDEEVRKVMLFARLPPEEQARIVDQADAQARSSEPV